MKRKIFVGTYTDKKSKGIYQFDFEDGKIDNAKLLCEIDNPKYLSNSNDNIIACCDFPDGSGVVMIDEEGNIKDYCIYEKPTSCYITSHNDKIYTANYHAGTFSELSFIDNKLTLNKTVKIKDKAGTHQVLFYQDKILVPCLFLDEVLVYDGDFNLINKIDFPKGSGPRHGVIIDNCLYLLSELSSELFKINLDTYMIEKSIILCDKKVSGGAAIRLSNDKKYLYVSIREENILVSVSIDDFNIIDKKDTGGDHPRDFIIVDDYLICANRFSDNINVRRINDGVIGETMSETKINDAVALIYR